MKVRNVLLILLVMLLVCITDFAIRNIPWDADTLETIETGEPLDMAFTDQGDQLMPWKLSKKRLTYKNQEIKIK